jgi:hypothetical protein
LVPVSSRRFTSSFGFVTIVILHAHHTHSETPSYLLDLAESGAQSPQIESSGTPGDRLLTQSILPPVEERHTLIVRRPFSHPEKDRARLAFKVGQGGLDLLFVLLGVHGRDGGVESAEKL